VRSEALVLPGVELDRFKVPRRRTIPTSDGWNPVLRYHLVQDVDALDWMLDVLRWADRDGISWDTETSGLKPELGARISGHCFACRTGEREIRGWYVPIRHTGPHNEHERQLDPGLVTERLKPLFAEGGEVITYHGKFDMKMARADGLWLQRPVSDVAIEATAFNENEPRFALKKLATKYCTPNADAEEKALDDWLRKDAHKLGLVFKKYNKKQRKKLKERGLDELSAPTYMQRFGYSRAPIKQIAKYGIHDVFFTWWLSKSKYQHVRTAFRDLWHREHDVMHMLCDMEWYGLPADSACIRDTHERTKAAVEHWLARTRQLAPQLIDVAFEATDAELRTLYYGASPIGLGMTPPKFTRKGNKPSVDKEARKLLEKQYPQYRELLEAIGNLATVLKIHTTYAGAYLRHYSPITESIHPNYNQLERRAEGGVPVTGRCSSSDPNAQNVLKKPLHLWDCLCPRCLKEAKKVAEKEGRPLFKTEEMLHARLQSGRAAENSVSIHRYFTVPDGHIRAYIDFSQIELCVLAWFCQDPVMLQAYREGRDLHQAIADELGIERDIAKQVNFGNSYGMTEFGLALRLPGYYDDPEGTRLRARAILDAYFTRFPRILAFRREFARLMRRNGCMFVNPLGRPRRIPDIDAQGDERWKRKRAERQMMSSIISGTSADLMKESMRRTNPIIRGVGGKMVQTVHDELVFDIPAKPGWTRTLISLKDRMEDWPMFSEDRPELPQYVPGRYGVPIKVSIELSTTNWADKREIEVVDGGFRWAA
jgi:DNA polymerase-1